MRQRPGNLFFSPLSIHTCLAMAALGARGETALQMHRVLGIEPGAKMPRPLPMLQQNPGDKDIPFELRMANALWGQRGYGWRAEYLEALRTQYGAGLREVDFAMATEAAGQINQWIGDQTQGKIKALIDPRSLSRDTQLVLTNAIYFKGRWETPFQTRATSRGAFHLPAGKTVQTPIMNAADTYRYASDERVQVLELAYAGHPLGNLSMVVIVPHAGEDLAQLETALTPQYIEQLRKACTREWVQLSLPKFRVQARVQLGSALAAMGMPLALSAQADFSGMSSQDALIITDVVHQACVDVNEEGTEAAAATATGIMVASDASTKSIVFRADRPFLFLIRENASGTILFLGRVTDPR